MEQEGLRCAFSLARRNVVTDKTKTSMAMSAVTFVTVPKHWELEYLWLERDWQGTESADGPREALLPTLGFLASFGDYATPARLLGVLVTPTALMFQHGVATRVFGHFAVHHTVACLIFDERVLKDTGISPHQSS